MATAFCFRSGEIHVGQRVPKGGVLLVTGRREQLDRAVSACSRLAYNGKDWLVPGLPEADDDDEAVRVTKHHIEQLKKRLSQYSKG